MSPQVLIFLFPSLLLTLAGCQSSCQMEFPQELPSSAIEQSLVSAAIDDVIDEGQYLPLNWWVLFNDEQLSCFIEKALAQNPTLRQTYAKMLLAAASANNLRANLFPNILWAADASRQKLSETGLIPFSQAAPPGIAGPSPAQIAIPAGLVPAYFTQYETEFNLSYDFDLWGKNRNAWESALSDIQVKAADDAFARLQLGIGVAKVYYQLQIEYQRRQIAHRQLEIKNSYVKLTHNRLNSGLDPLMAIETARTNLSNAEASLLQIDGSIAIYENKLRAYLADDFQEYLEVAAVKEEALPIVPVPLDFPLRMVAYRPDIVADLWAIESAGRQIDVAKAGFYPDLSLNALIGYQTIHLKKLFQSPLSLFFNVDPAISLPFFDAGRLAANLRGSEINYDLAIAKYNETIINATREVLDALALLKNAELQFKTYKQTLKHQEELYRLAFLRQENNLDSNLDVILIEAQKLQAEDQQVIAIGNQLQAILSLIQATGGGYYACCE